MNTRTDLPEHFGPSAPEPIDGFAVKVWENKDDTDTRIVVTTSLTNGPSTQSQGFGIDDADWLTSMAIDLLKGAEVLRLAEQRRERTARNVATLTEG